MSINLTRFITSAAALAIATATVGCASPKYTFSVSLKNASAEPVTVWLTKSGGPDEDEWLSPEQIYSSRAAALGEINGSTIPPGKTGEIGPLAGRFDRDSMAILRVYAGQLTLDQLLATPPDGKLRVDVPLREGMNRLVVSPNLPLKVEPAGAATGAPK